MIRRIAMLALVTLAIPSAAQEGGDGGLVIKGKVQKPEVLVTVARRNLDRGFTLDLKESFLHKIVDALDEEPF